MSERCQLAQPSSPLHPLLAASSRRLLVALGALLVLLAAPPAWAAAAEGPAPEDPSAAWLHAFEARSLGPAVMSGRVAALAVDPADERRIWVGTATGGLWLSEDGGYGFEPVFDDQPVAAIGALAIDPTAPDVVWVGTGEGNPRNSTSIGNGLYKTLDGGRTWSHLGLGESERIHRILLDPRDSDTAYVCAMGPTWGDGDERGVYKTTDGGATWAQVLAGTPRTGCADLVMDPSNPNKLFAALWEHRREPWFFVSGGPTSGLYRTIDGGATWEEVRQGLPAGDLGRIGLAIAPSDPSRVYALVEAETNGIYRSDDGGYRFRLMSESADSGNRPFYYADLRVDPQDPDRLYSLFSRVGVSTDGGATWDILVGFRSVHPDHHALWIDPDDPHHLYLGNDGGVYESEDHGETWRFVRSLPVPQIYHVRVDDDHPYNVYFGLQDNGSWRGPSEVWTNRGIQDHHWSEIHFGDGFDALPDPEDSMRGYALAQDGNLVRWNLRTGERKAIRPALGDAPEGTDALRFNWSAALAVDPFDPGTLYLGSQFVHRSRDRGDTWETISPDLTTDRPEWQRQAESGGLTRDVTAAENFTTLVAIAPSPIEPGLLWVGSDDGRIHVGRGMDGPDGTWTSVEANVPGVPEHTWVPHIHPSNHDAATAFAVFDDHRRSNFEPYAHVTRDYGATWQRLDTSGVRGYALTILQDPVDPDLLFLGTEFGLWVSRDGGGSFAPMGHGVPTVSVMDLAFQEREADLVLGTHGRGVYVFDDLSPLRGLEPEILDQTLHLFPVAGAQQYRSRQDEGGRFAGDGLFRGENEPYGALITFSVAGSDLPAPGADDRSGDGAGPRMDQEGQEIPGASAEDSADEGAETSVGEGSGESGEGVAEPKPDREVEIEITDAAGEAVQTWEEPVHRGVNRVTWDLRREAVRRPSGEDLAWFAPRGPEVLPGTYTVTLRFRGEEVSGPVEVLADPRFDISPEDRLAKDEAILEAARHQERLADAIDRLRRTQQDLGTYGERLDRQAERAEEDGDDEAAKRYEDLATEARDAEERLLELEQELWITPEMQGYYLEETPWNRITRIQRELGSSWDAPTPSQLYNLTDAVTAATAAAIKAERTLAEDIAPLAKRLEASGAGLLGAVDEGGE